MTENRGRESNQLPEEAPEEQIVEDVGGGRRARDEARRSPGGAGEEGRSTGHWQESEERERESRRKEAHG